MKAYFTRKPMTIEDAKANAAWAKAEHQEPVEVTPIAFVSLTLQQSTPEGLGFPGTLR